MTKHKGAMRDGNVNNHIAIKTPFTGKTSNRMGLCDMYYVFYRLLSMTHLESWFTDLEQTLLSRTQQLPAPHKRLIDEIKQN